MTNTYVQDQIAKVDVSEVLNKYQTRIAENEPRTVAEVKKNVDLIQNIMREVMIEGQHYGKIPGCGDKPTLLKSGAEKLSLTFRFYPIINNVGDVCIQPLKEGHINVQVFCHIMTANGREIATGIGSCSTMESKYRYRGGEKKGTGKSVPKEYWNLKDAGKSKEAHALIGGSGFTAGKVDGTWQICEVGEKMENPDIADVYNTVLKMAKKRAYVDGILSATCASDIFTQDVEDATEETGIVDPSKKQTPVQSEPQQNQPYNGQPVVGIKSVTSKPGNTNGKAWVKYYITTSEGETASTFDKKIAELAEKAKAEDFGVIISKETKGRYTNIVGMERMPEPDFSDPTIPVDDINNEDIPF